MKLNENLRKNSENLSLAISMLTGRKLKNRSWKERLAKNVFFFFATKIPYSKV